MTDKPKEEETKQLKFRLQGDLLRDWESIRWREMNERKNSRVEQALVELALWEFVSKYRHKRVPTSPDTYTEELHEPGIPAVVQSLRSDFSPDNLMRAVMKMAAQIEELSAAFRKIQNEIGPSSGDDKNNPESDPVSSNPGVGEEDITKLRRAIKRALGDPERPEQKPVPGSVRGVHGIPRRGKPKDRGDAGGGGAPPPSVGPKREKEETLLLHPAEGVAKW